MSGYSPALPRDSGGETKFTYVPPKVALARAYKENAVASSILLLSHDTTEIEVAAVNQHIALKWLSQSTIDSSVAGTSVITATGSGNWDHLVQQDTVRRFVVPIGTNPQTAGSVQGINRELGLFPAVAYKTFAGNGSVLTGEFGGS